MHASRGRRDRQLQLGYRHAGKGSVSVLALGPLPAQLNRATDPDSVRMIFMSKFPLVAVTKLSTLDLEAAKPLSALTEAY